MLYEATSERQSRMMKTVAAALGAEVQESPSSGVQGQQGHTVYDEYDLADLPLGIGYEKIN